MADQTKAEEAFIEKYTKIAWDTNLVDLVECVRSDPRGYERDGDLMCL